MRTSEYGFGRAGCRVKRGSPEGERAYVQGMTALLLKAEPAGDP